MLLDRKRINRWAKIMSAVMAVVFGLSFVALGVGSGTGLNWSDLWNSLGGNRSSQASSQTPEQQIKTYQAALQTDPKNATALLGLANAYKSLEQPALEAAALEKLAEVKPDDATIPLRLGAIYMAAETRDYAAAVRVLNSATTLDPGNANAFLQLGAAERGVGNSNAAILAWNRYLQLQPTGDMAQTVKEQIAALQAQAATTTTVPGATTTTVP